MQLSPELLKSLEEASRKIDLVEDLSPEQILKKESIEWAFKGVNLSHWARERLQSLVQDDRITLENFEEELEKMTSGIFWKTNYVFHKGFSPIFHFINSITLTQVCFFSALLLLIFFLKRQYPVSFQKTQKKVFGFLNKRLVGFVAVVGYYVSLVSIYNSYLTSLLTQINFRPLEVFLQFPFIREAMIFQSNYSFIEYIYFYFVIFVVQRQIFPRFVRFHWVRGLMISIMAIVPYNFYQIITLAFRQPLLVSEQPFGLLLFLFVLNMYWTLPAIIEALTLSYPKAWIIRDAIEIALGREPDDDWTWWDRKPRRPKRNK